MEDINSTNKTNQLPPDNHLAWAIISTLLCCWPFGIPAIISASKVDTYWKEGHYDAAQKAADDAKKWATISAVAAVAFWVIYLLVVAISAAVGVSLLG